MRIIPRAALRRDLPKLKGGHRTGLRKTSQAAMRVDQEKDPEGREGVRRRGRTRTGGGRIVIARSRLAIQGSALIAVYWVIALLSLSVFTMSQILVGDVESRVTQTQIYRAEQLAEMGLAIAGNPRILPGDPLLQQAPYETEAFQATIESESARININATLAAGERIVLESLFQSWGATEAEALTVVDSLIDPDDSWTHFVDPAFPKHWQLNFPQWEFETRFQQKIEFPTTLQNLFTYGDGQAELAYFVGKEWSNYSDFLEDWMQPRLVSVKGRDILLEVTERESGFSCTFVLKDAASNKVIDKIGIATPSTGAIPSNHHKFIVKGQRKSYEITWDDTDKALVSVMKVDGQTITQKRYQEGAQSVGGQSLPTLADGERRLLVYDDGLIQRVEWKRRYGETYDFEEDEVDLEFVTVASDTGEERTTDFTYTPGLERMDYTGTNWNKDGTYSEIDRSRDFQMLSSATVKRAGELVTITHTLNNNKITTSEVQGGQETANTEVTFEQGLRKITSLTDGMETVSTFHSAFDAENGEVPWLLKSVTAPGNQRKEFTYEFGEDIHTVTSLSGSGTTTVTTGTKSVVKTNPQGGLISRTVSVHPEGTVLDNTTGEEHSDDRFQLPKTLTHMDGSKTKNVQLDPQGRLTNYISAFDQTWQAEYDGLDRLKKSTTKTPKEGGSSTLISNFGYENLDRTITTGGNTVQMNANLFRGESVTNGHDHYAMPSSSSVTPTGTQSFTMDGRDGEVHWHLDGSLAEIVASHGQPGLLVTYGVETIGQDSYFAVTERLGAAGATSTPLSKTFYDGLGRPVQVDTPSPGGVGTGSTEFEYDPAARKVTVKPPGDLPVTITASQDNRTLTYERNGVSVTRESSIVGGAIQTDLKLDSTVLSRVITQLHTDKGPTIQVQPFAKPDREWKLEQKQAGPEFSTTLTGPFEQSITRTYFGGRFKEVKSKALNGTGSASVERDDRGWVTSQSSTSLAGLSYQVDYDSDFKVDKITGPEGEVTDFTYSNPEGDPTGYKVEANNLTNGIQSKSEWDSDGSPGHASGFRSYAADYDVDFGDSDYTITMKTDRGSGLVERETKYSLAGYPLSQHTAGDLDWEYTWNPNGSPATYENARGDIATFGYDANKYADSLTFSGGATNISLTNNNLGQPTQITDASGTRTVGYNDQFQIKSHKWTAGLLNGIHVGAGYDKYGLPNRVDFGLTTGQSPFWVGYERDDHGRVNQITAPNGGQVDYKDFANGTAFAQRIERGEVVTTRLLDPELRVDKYTTTGPDLQWKVEYDPTYNDRDLIETVEVTWTGLGDLADNRSGTWTYTYDDLGQLENAEFDSINGILRPPLTYEYDPLGNRIAANLAQELKLGSEDSGFVIDVELGYSTNAKNQYTSVNETGGGLSAVVMRGRVTEGQGTVVTFAINGGAPTVVAVDSEGYFAQSVALTSSAQILTIDGTLPGGGHNGADAVARREVILPGIGSIPNTGPVAYDADGNLTSDGSWNYAWNDRNQLDGMERPNSYLTGNLAAAENLTFKYNLEGERVYKLYERTPTRIEEDPMTGVRSPVPGPTVGHEVGVNNVVKLIPGITREHLFIWYGGLLLGEQITETLEGEDPVVWVRQYVWGQQGVELIWDGRSGRWLVPVYDHTGSVALVVDMLTGEGVASYHYSAFGGTEQNGDEYWRNVCPFRFKGFYYDRESQLACVGTSFYSLVWGRWIKPSGSRDAINPYTFNNNDPVNAYRPSWAQQVPLMICHGRDHRGNLVPGMTPLDSVINGEFHSSVSNRHVIGNLIAGATGNVRALPKDLGNLGWSLFNPGLPPDPVSGEAAADPRAIPFDAELQRKLGREMAFAEVDHDSPVTLSGGVMGDMATSAIPVAAILKGGKYLALVTRGVAEGQSLKNARVMAAIHQEVKAAAWADDVTMDPRLYGSPFASEEFFSAPSGNSSRGERLPWARTQAGVAPMAAADEFGSLGGYGGMVDDGLTVRDPYWPWRGLHQEEIHHLLMRGRSFRKFWKDRGFTDAEIEGYTIPLPKDIHRAISDPINGGPGWWEARLFGDIGEAEAILGRNLNKAEVTDISERLIREVLSW